MKSIFFLLIFIILLYEINSIYDLCNINGFLVVIIFFIALFGFIKRLSKKFVFLDIIILLATIQYLLSPYIAYTVFNKSNDLALLWDTYMKLPQNEYFGFVLPASLLFFIGLKFPLNYETRISDQVFIANAKLYLFSKGYISIVLLFMGVIFTFLTPLLPKILQGFSYYFAQLTYIGVFYALFSNFKNKYLVVSVAVMLTLLQTINTGMYGELVFWSLLISTLKLMDYDFALYKKIIFLIFGVFFIFLIQSIKADYRSKTWSAGGVRDGDAGYFGELVLDNLKDPFKIFEPNRLFGMANRMNQGGLIAQTMNYVPKHEPFANGETIIKACLASLVPRILWPDKPESGGRDMIVRFLGAPDDLEFSYNISPMGEAYVNFGKFGGSIFMFFYGLFFNMILVNILRISLKIPSLVLWLPILFIGPIHSIEGDVSSALNSLVKAGLFSWMIYFSFRLLFKIRL
jgi:hypothetical protein